VARAFAQNFDHADAGFSVAVGGQLHRRGRLTKTREHSKHISFARAGC
jgi:hypothetical protein